MDKKNYRVGTTPIRHNGHLFSVGEPVALTEDEAKALQGHVTLDPVQADPPAPPAPPEPSPATAEPPAQAPASEPASAPAPAAAATEAPATAPAADAPKADAKGKGKPGEKA